MLFEDGSELISDNSLRLTDVQTGRELANMITGGGPPGAIAFSPDRVKRWLTTVSVHVFAFGIRKQVLLF